MPLTASGLRNAFRVTARLLSGSQPEGDAAFAELVRLRVKTIVSVDGARPDVAGARKFGLRYIHLPIGYDGVSARRLAELAQAAAVPGGATYVHCHHGRHRGPAAVGIMCAAVEGWAPARAEAWLRQAGTGEEYPGLYRAVRDFRAAPHQGEQRAIDLPEVAEPTPLVAAMVAIDAHFDVLKVAQKSGWKNPPQSEVTLLGEHFRELSRQEITAARPARYREILATAERAAEELRTSLRASDPAAADVAFTRLAEDCAACHRTFRNEQGAR